MATIIRCDRCKTEKLDKHSFGKAIRTTPISNLNLEYDLCGNCDSDFVKFLRNEAVNKNENQSPT